MTIINKLENIDFSDFSYRESGVNLNIYHAYQRQKETKNEFIDFHELSHIEDIVKFVQDLKGYGIEYITISHSFYGLLNILDKFESQGCKITALTKIKDTYDGKVSAIKIKL